MSHEIRTPLNGIIGFSNLLISDDITKTEMNEFAGIILKSGKRLIEIVNNVLDVSKIETGQVEIYKRSVPVNTIIKDLHGLFSHHAEVVNLDLNYQIAFDDSYNIFSDDSKIHQILSNLINNALKFTESGSIDFGYEVIDDFLQFFVKDTGIGISEENRYKIFERFTQVDLSINRGYEGAGLGLAICKGLAELLGGRIWVESEVGVGSVFYFTIPTN